LAAANAQAWFASSKAGTILYIKSVLPETQFLFTIISSLESLNILHFSCNINSSKRNVFQNTFTERNWTVIITVSSSILCSTWICL